MFAAVLPVRSEAAGAVAGGLPDLQRKVKIAA
jgi:hypothetical protein